SLRQQRSAPGVLEQRLQGAAHLVQALVGAGGGEELDAGGQAVLGQPAGQGDARHAGEVGGDGGDVVHVHRGGVVDLLAEAEGDGGRGGRGEHGDLLEGGSEVALHERAHLLRAAVVGVVVAGREGVGAQQDAALDLVAEAGAAGGLHDVLGGGVVLGDHPQAEPHAVELGEVRGGLRRHDQVV